MESEQLTSGIIAVCDFSLELSELELQSLVAITKQPGWKVLTKCFDRIQGAAAAQSLGNATCTRIEDFLAFQANYMVAGKLKDRLAESAQQALIDLDERKQAAEQTTQV